MLILSRRVGESLKIGAEVSITVLGVQGNHVRLGVDAPKSVIVQRAEIAGRVAPEESGTTKEHQANRKLEPPAGE